MLPLYFPDFLSGYAYSIIFEHLMGLDYLNATEARKEYFMSDIERTYTYGKGVGQRTYVSKPFSDMVSGIRNLVNVRLHASYDICFINRYDNFKNNLGWHSDDGIEMDNTHPIGVMSFGAEREIWWKPQNFKGEVPKENRLKLEQGSLFVMPVGFQELYYHKIPKADNQNCGTRISLTFRKYKD